MASIQKSKGGTDTQDNISTLCVLAIWQKLIIRRLFG